MIYLHPATSDTYRLRTQILKGEDPVRTFRQQKKKEWGFQPILRHRNKANSPVRTTSPTKEFSWISSRCDTTRVNAPLPNSCLIPCAPCLANVPLKFRFESLPVLKKCTPSWVSPLTVDRVDVHLKLLEQMEDVSPNLNIVELCSGRYKNYGYPTSNWMSKRSFYRWPLRSFFPVLSRFL